MKNRSIILIITIAILGFYLSSCVEDVLDIDDTKKTFQIWQYGAPRVQLKCISQLHTNIYRRFSSCK